MSHADRIASLTSDIQEIASKVAQKRDPGTKWDYWFEEKPDRFTYKPRSDGEGGVAEGVFSKARIEKMFGSKPTNKEIANELAVEPGGRSGGPGRPYSDRVVVTKKGPNWVLTQRWGIDV